MTTTAGPWIVERYDCEDGTINYEIWSHRPSFHRVVTLSDYDNENAKDDAELIARAVNALRKDQP